MAPLFHEPARSSDWTFFGPGANGQALINLLNGFAGGPNPLAAHARNIQQNFGRMVNLRVVKGEHITRLFSAVSFIFISLWIPYLFQAFVKVFNDTLTLAPYFIVISTMLSFSHVAFVPMAFLLLGSPLRGSFFRRTQGMCSGDIYGGVPTSESETTESNIRCIELSV